MVTYALQGPAHAGASITLVAPAGTAGDLATTGQGIGLLVLNSGGTAVSVVLPVVATYDGLTVVNRVVSCGPLAGGIPSVTLIPLPDNVYGVGTTAIAYSSQFQLAVGLIRIP
jgi:hypothetical protein